MTQEPRKLWIPVLILLMILFTPIFFSNSIIKFEEGFERHLIILKHTTYTFIRSLFTFTISYLICYAFSILIAWKSQNIVRRADKLLSGLRALPAIAWLPIIGVIPVVKIYDVTVIGGLVTFPAMTLFVLLGTGPLILAQILHGFTECPEEKLILGKIAPVKRIRLLTTVIIPNSLPYLIQAMRYGIAIAFILIVVHDQLLTPNWGFKRVFDMMAMMDFPFEDAVFSALLLASCGLLLDQIVQFVGYGITKFIKRRRFGEVKQAQVQ